MGERLEEAARENDMLESEVIRRALRYYEDANPDGIAAFEDVQHGPTVVEVDPANLPRKGEGTDEIAPSAEPVEEADDQEGSDDEENTDEEDMEGGVPYDPTKDV